jgi:hypothetical protein
MVSILMNRFSILVIISVAHLFSSLALGTEAQDQNGETVRRIWKRAIVEDQRDYDRMIAALRKVILNAPGSKEALTAELLMGRIEVNRTDTEALGSFAKAKETLGPLAAKHPKTWQGQLARLGLLHILHLDKDYKAAIVGAEKALNEIDWDTLGKKAPSDLAEFKKTSDIAPELTPDFLRPLIAKSYIALKQPKEAEKWLSEIENKEIRREVQQAPGAR